MLADVVSHFFTIFFCRNPCEMFHSRMRLTTDFIFIYGYTFLYQIQIITKNILLVFFLIWDLCTVYPLASCSISAPWKAEQALLWQAKRGTAMWAQAGK